MKLVSIDGALATMIRLGDEVGPLNGYYLPELFRLIGDRYGLQTIPSLEEANATGAKFRTGQFQSGDRAINITELAIYSDGLSAITKDTKDSELVIRDLSLWLKDSLGFRDPITSPTIFFQSDLVVDFDNDPEKAFGFISPLIKFIDKERESIYRINKPLQFGRIGVGADPLQGHAFEFGFERRIGAPWNLNRYFCKAHLPTDVHMRALEMLDALIGKAAKT